MSDGKIRKGYLVSSCGCTDCFPAAIFFDLDEAETYGMKHFRFNPEGYRVQEIDVSSLSLRWD